MMPVITEEHWTFSLAMVIVRLAQEKHEAMSGDEDELCERIDAALGCLEELWPEKFAEIRTRVHAETVRALS